jgi:hypothetical protein
MWLGHSASWWGLVLAILALFLMLPANLLANFMTPILKNWWAERSRKSLELRIERLKATLTEAEKFQPMTLTEDHIFMGIENLATLIQYSIQILAGCGLTVASVFLLPSRTKIFWLTEVFVYVLVLINYSTSRNTMRLIRNFHRRFGPIERVGLQMSIDKLTAKLARYK